MTVEICALIVSVRGADAAFAIDLARVAVITVWPRWPFAIIESFVAGCAMKSCASAIPGVRRVGRIGAAGWPQREVNNTSEGVNSSGVIAGSNTDDRYSLDSGWNDLQVGRRQLDSRRISWLVGHVSECVEPYGVETGRFYDE